MKLNPFSHDFEQEYVRTLQRTIIQLREEIDRMKKAKTKKSIVTKRAKRSVKRKTKAKGIRIGNAQKNHGTRKVAKRPKK